MGSSLTGTKIRDTYDALIKVSDNGALDGTLQTLTDGLGNNSALSLSTAGASVTGTLAVSGNAAFDTNTLFVDASNNRVGVGIASPTTPVEIVSSENTLLYLNSSTATVYLRLDDANSINGNFIGATTNDMHFWTNNTERMRIDSSGNVGIGTSSLTAAAGYGTLSINGTSGGQVAFQTAGTLEAYIYNTSSVLDIGTVSGNDITISAGATERMRIDSDGNVGIGVTPSGAKLQVYSTGAQDNVVKIQNGQAGYASVLQLQNATDGGAIYNYISSGTVGSTAMWQIGGGAATNTMALYTGGTERMRIDSSGVVQVRNQSAVFQLYNTDTSVTTGQELGSIDFYTSDISAARVSSYVKSTFNSAFGDSYLTFGTSTGVSAASERMRINSEGNLLVGCTGVSGAGGSVQGASLLSSGAISVYRAAAPSGYFARSNAGELIAFFNNTAQVGSISVGASSTAYNTSSDYRLKEDWVAMEGALDRVDALKPVNFAWKSSGDRVDGFLAHELAEVVPEAVTGEKDATEIRSVEVSPAVYEDVIHPAEEAVYDEIIHEAVEAVYETIEHPAIAEELDEEGNVLVEAQEAWTEQILISEGQEEWIERILVSEAKEEWVEKVLVSEAVFEDQEFPVYQGIDQSKVVPLLVAGLQEAHDLIKSLQARIEALEG